MRHYVTKPITISVDELKNSGTVEFEMNTRTNESRILINGEPREEKKTGPLKLLGTVYETQPIPNPLDNKN